MKQRKITQIFFVFILGACLWFFPHAVIAKTIFHGLKVSKAHGGLGGEFTEVESCTPVLAWEGSPDPKMTYDVIVWQALQARRKNLNAIPGQELFYQESISGNSIRVTPALPEKSNYFWSVRTRSSQGEVSPWSTYYYEGFFEYRDNVNFGFKTPFCNQVPNNLKAKNKKDDKSSGKLSLTRNPKDSKKINKLLAEGKGGFAVYVAIPLLKNKDPRSYDTSSREALVRSIKEKEDAFLDLGLLFYIAPGEKEERYLRPGKDHFFFLLAKPGEYLLTRFVFGGGLANRSIRIFKKISVDPGKIKYAGDTLMFGHRGGFFGKGFNIDFLFNYDFDDAARRFLDKHPALEPGVFIANESEIEKQDPVKQQAKGKSKKKAAKNTQ